MKEASRALPPEAMENEANEDSTSQAASPDNCCRITIYTKAHPVCETVLLRVTGQWTMFPGFPRKLGLKDLI
jgi:hypothetical protein